MRETYTHGHQEAVLRSHRWRSAENSAAYLIPHLSGGHSLLDVGCGPGTITMDLARLVSPGRVIGIDPSPEVIEEAKNLTGAQPGRDDGAGTAAEEGPVDSPGPEPYHLEFRVGDVYGLDFPDSSFDVVHAHQVLQHLSDPVRALEEAKRVLKPGGLLAVRDSDYAGFIWSPRYRSLERWNDIYHAVCRRNGADADTGRLLPALVRQAGFGVEEVSSSTWTFADEATRTWWGGVWADRCRESSFAAQAVEYGIAEASEISSIADSWRRWAAEPDGLFVVPHLEVLARRRA
jgi:ubiquinone/menaquinone biosynthesis C-methylase UbiE